MSIEQDNRQIVEIWKEFQPVIAAFCRQKLRSCPSEVDDVVADVFKALVDEARKNKIPNNPKAWLFKVANNHINKKYDEMRKYRERIVKVDFENSELVELRFGRDMTDEMIDDMDIESLKEQLLHKLPEKDRKLLEYLYEDKLKQKEAAVLLGTTKSAVKMRLCRLKAKIDKMADEDVENFL